MMTSLMETSEKYKFREKNIEKCDGGFSVRHRISIYVYGKVYFRKAELLWLNKKETTLKSWE